MAHYKGYTIRLFPSKDQEVILFQHINSCRWIWNYMIEINMKSYESGNGVLSHFQMSSCVPYLRKENEWLKNVDSHSLTLTCKDISERLDMFFTHKANFPKFKSKRTAKKAYPVRGERIRFRSSNIVKIPSIGDMKYRFDYRKETINLNSIFPRNPRIFLSKNGKWIMSFNVEYENQILQNKVGPLGIDMGLRNIATYSYIDIHGNILTEVVHNLNRSKKLHNLDKRINHLKMIMDRKIASAKKQNRDWSDSKNYEKVRIKRQKLLYHRTNLIRDEYDKITSHIVNELHPKIIWMEDLDIRKMRKNPIYRKDISNANWGLFRNMIEYKSDRIGIPVLYTPKNFPSSQICSNCGARNEGLKDWSFVFKCPSCGYKEDRDVNASINLMNYEDDRIISNYCILNIKRV